MTRRAKDLSTFNLETLGRALRLMRSEAKLHQADLASLAGITRPMLSAYEKGRVEPKIQTLWQLLHCMEMDLGHLEIYMDWVDRRRVVNTVGPRLPEDQARMRLGRAMDEWLDALAERAAGGGESR